MQHDIDFGVLTATQASRAYAAGDAIFNQGDAASEMFVVKSGSVEIRLGDRVLETVGAHGVFGEMALIDGAPRSATAVAAEATELVPISEKQFIFLVGETPYFALNVLRTLARRLRATTSITA